MLLLPAVTMPAFGQVRLSCGETHNTKDRKEPDEIVLTPDGSRSYRFARLPGTAVNFTVRGQRCILIEFSASIKAVSQISSIEIRAILDGKRVSGGVTWAATRRAEKRDLQIIFSGFDDGSHTVELEYVVSPKFPAIEMIGRFTQVSW